MKKSAKILRDEKTSELRIGSYNILKGGQGRLDKISKVIKEINPDICGILEAVEWQNNLKFFEKMANDLEYKFFDFALANTKYNIAIFSKIPLKIKKITKGIHHVVLEATITGGVFKGLNIFFIHLSPVSEDARLLEIEKLLKPLKKSSETIIIGDFNSLSARDPYNKRKILNIFQTNNITKYGTDKLRFEVIDTVESAGLVDVAKYLKYPFTSTTPTPSNKDKNHAAHIRIDYAFLTKNIIKYIKKIEVFKNDPTDKASDHYPLFIELIK